MNQQDKEKILEWVELNYMPFRGINGGDYVDKDYLIRFIESLSSEVETLEDGNYTKILSVEYAKSIFHIEDPNDEIADSWPIECFKNGYMRFNGKESLPGGLTRIDDIYLSPEEFKRRARNTFQK